jgi:Spy/CpxP family protein refolding chaperone
MIKLTSFRSVLIALTVLGSTILPLNAQAAPQAKQIELSETQKSEIIKIRETTNDRINAVLTDEQKEQLEVAMQQGQDPRQAFGSLELSTEQQQQIQTILTEANQQSQEVLTPEQLEQLQQMQQTPQQPPE